MYLGIKFALRRMTGSDFHILLEKAIINLNVWGNHFISLAEKLLLVKSVFTSLPTFLSTHSLVPLGVLNYLERMCRDFFVEQAGWE